MKKLQLKYHHTNVNISSSTYKIKRYGLDLTLTSNNRNVYNEKNIYDTTDNTGHRHYLAAPARRKVSHGNIPSRSAYKIKALRLKWSAPIIKRLSLEGFYLTNKILEKRKILLSIWEKRQILKRTYKHRSNKSEMALQRQNIDQKTQPSSDTRKKRKIRETAS